MVVNEINVCCGVVIPVKDILNVLSGNIPAEVEKKLKKLYDETVGEVEAKKEVVTKKKYKSDMEDMLCDLLYQSRDLFAADSKISALCSELRAIPVPHDVVEGNKEEKFPKHPIFLGMVVMRYDRDSRLGYNTSFFFMKGAMKRFEEGGDLNWLQKEGQKAEIYMLGDDCDCCS